MARFASEEARLHWNEYNNEYAKKSYKSICIKLSRKNDADVIDFIQNSDKSPTDIFRAAIRKEINK